ncbi:hypothetical protein ATP06_0206490 [Amycolatopsis regifaucium]|uniref:DUF222 domain-containing protein n=1 Tax=Amycolatopsis regifaucium TaxID=546365 RepID=A0ABX3DXL5_9PSEU|nr:hypothetical protein ATP06_0206490 [Amycolatopsis regifaucium]
MTGRVDGLSAWSHQVENALVRRALSVARAAERCGCLGPGDWPDVAVSMLLEGNEDPEIAELAGFSRQVNGWVTEPLVAAVCERHGVSTPGPSESTELVARLMADDLRARPASVTAPMIRLLARLAPPAFESDLASRCFEVKEYLDCDCAYDDPDFEAELHLLPTLRLPAPLVQALARPLRSTLPPAQPARRH